MRLRSTCSSPPLLKRTGYLVRTLAPWRASLGKRLVKQPRVYWRDSGILHHLLGLDSPEAILDHPKAGASWEGFIVEQIITRERRANPSTGFHFFRTHTGAECDLLLARGKTLVPIEIKISSAIGGDDAGRLRAVMKMLGARHGHIVSNAKRTATLGDITVWNARALLTGASWL